MSDTKKKEKKKKTSEKTKKAKKSKEGQSDSTTSVSSRQFRTVASLLNVKSEPGLTSAAGPASGGETSRLQGKSQAPHLKSAQLTPELATSLMSSVPG